MALKLELRMGERIVLGDCLVINEGGRTRLCIEGNVPVLRERDMLTTAMADTPSKRLYLALQTLYLSRDRERFDVDYLRVRDEWLGAQSTFSQIDDLLAAGNVYQALKAARRLFQDEQTMEFAQQAEAGVRVLEATRASE